MNEWMLCGGRKETNRRKSLPIEKPVLCHLVHHQHQMEWLGMI